MFELFRASYYWTDLIIGYTFPFFVYGLFRAGRVSNAVWRLYWLGCLVGLFWEVPIFILSGQSTPLPIIFFARELPVHYLVLMVCHTLWDGGLFLAGVWLVHLLCPDPILTRFRWRELAVFLLWGQTSALAVELSSTLNDGWVYVSGYWWNPVLFTFNDHPVTVLPQLIWMVAPVVYYLAVIRNKEEKIVRNFH